MEPPPLSKLTPLCAKFGFQWHEFGQAKTEVRSMKASSIQAMEILRAIDGASERHASRATGVQPRRQASDCSCSRDEHFAMYISGLPRFILREMERALVARFEFREEKAMCDYSLTSVQNRLAVCGEELVVRRFEIRTMGLASVADVKAADQVPPQQGFWEKLKTGLFPPDTERYPAVCIPPGARLLLRDVPETMQAELRLRSAVQVVVFRELETSGYRDAVRFENGAEVLLQRLSEGQRVRVLSLEPDEATDTVAEPEKAVTMAAA